MPNYTKQQLLAKPTRLKRKVYAAPSPIHGKGLYANHDIEADSYIGTYRGLHTLRDGKYVLWTFPEDRQPMGRRGMNLLRFLNHPENPNAEFDGYDLYATRPIDAHEEITIDYGGFE